MIALADVRKSYPGGVTALDGVSLTVGAGELVAIVGPSGSGKSTMLHLIGTLDRPSGGTVEIAGQVVGTMSDAGLSRLRATTIGFVFQQFHLAAGVPALDNVADGLLYAGVRRAARLRKAASALERVGLGHRLDHKPHQLSGGERQRVALARALARDPRILLLDEPLSALDAHTKATVRAELRELLRELQLPTLLVTHDFEDAAVLAQQVGVVVDGRLVQIDTPQALVAAPANPFVASLTGANLIEGIARMRGDLTEVALDDGTTIYSTNPATGRVGVVIYPWEITVSDKNPVDSALNHLSGSITSLVTVDNRVRVQIGQLTAETSLGSAQRLDLREGGRVVASFKATATRLLPLP